ncbi:hypothetical protein KM043_005711 [Ampulex compressa]|nr:hypothetical protein KM043_005711 [Ampulex compressa]
MVSLWVLAPWLDPRPRAIRDREDPAAGIDGTLRERTPPAPSLRRPQRIEDLEDRTDLPGSPRQSASLPSVSRRAEVVEHAGLRIARGHVRFPPSRLRTLAPPRLGRGPTPPWARARATGPPSKVDTKGAGSEPPAKHLLGAPRRGRNGFSGHRDVVAAHRLRRAQRDPFALGSRKDGADEGSVTGRGG